MDKKVIFLRDKRAKNGGKHMTIGNILKERMDCFNISEEALCEEALIESEELQAILSNEVSYSEIDEVTLSFISQVLYCSPEYFADKQLRDKDLVRCSLNRGASTPKSNEVKGILQMFSEDFSFLIELKEDLKGGI
ncbi:hypothetical protein [Alkalihalobacillus pseudalcaliphilus]|uniref:hypothetical protein n=1 Tax=Alkalihalobacillus pseudalcaliphilus TaxID=79884 RepID=UPI00064D8129|nr:hypothetical protein [Alkalihalobacillus pseudalcaliphilus]KMK77959.1 hypothetical protein AB990_00410 [Alkalihalobacillus pseudalcaliphilus]